MPYKKRYKNKRKKYNRRLADKKINTLVEKRIDDISKKNIAKNKQWLYNGAYIKNPNIAKFGRFGYDFEDGFQLSYNGRTADSTEAAPLSMICASAIGNQPAMIQRGAHTNTDGFQNTFNVDVRKAYCYLRAENRLEHDVTICVSLVFIPNDSQLNTPDQVVSDMITYTDSIYTVCGGNPAGRWRGNFRKMIENYTDPNPTIAGYNNLSFQVLKRKTIKLKGVVDSGKSGSTASKSTSTYKDIVLTHMFKRNKNLTYNCKRVNNLLFQASGNGNVYAVVTSDLGAMITPGQRLSDVRIQGIAGIEYCLLDQELPNNNVNPLTIVT